MAANSFNPSRLPLAASLTLLGFGAAGTGSRIEGGVFLMVAGAAVVAIGILTAFTKGEPAQVRYVPQPMPIPRMPEGVEAHVAWSGEGPPPDELRDALRRMNVTLDQEAPVKDEGGTKIFTARMGPGGILTNEDDLRTRGLEGTALIKSAKNLHMVLGDRTLVELILTVRVPGLEPYSVKDLSMAPTDQLITVAANLTVPVLVDPDDPARLMVDWDRG